MTGVYAVSIEDWVHEGPNQDTFALADDMRAGAVFDGLAGHPGSWKASQLAAQLTQEHFAHRPDRRWSEQTADAARTALQAARAADRDHPQMTCAAVFAQITEEDVEIAWCGDCRAYRLWPDGRLVRLTDDHDVLYRMVMHDRISLQRATAARFALEDADTASDAFRRGGSIAKKLFKKGHLMVTELSSGVISVARVNWDPTSALVLTSDGVHDNLLGSQMRQIAASSPVGELAGTLVHAAKQRAEEAAGRAHSDDITCVVLPPLSA